MATVLIALGSNLGDRYHYLQRAGERLHALPRLRVLKWGQIYETAPVGGPANQGAYLNTTLVAETTLSPEELLQRMLLIEKDLGRIRSVQDAPRTIDLDLIFYGSLVQTDRDPLLPHPRMQLRRFVLQPAADVVPEWQHPQLGLTIAQMLDQLPPEEDLPQIFPKPLLPKQLPLAGLRAMVTGAASGIGKAIAHTFAQSGAELIIHTGKSEEKLISFAQELAADGYTATTIVQDLATGAGCRTFTEQVWAQGPVDIFVHNAGVDLLTGDAPTWDIETKLQALFEMDIRSNVLLCRDFGQRMQHRGSGSIITIGWDQAETGMEGDSGQLFAATKAAIMAFSRSLAVSLAPQVRVNNIAPGWIKTAWGEGTSDAWHNRVEQETPLQRWGIPQDVAQAALWLANPTSGFITGQTIRVNGGAVRL